MSASDVFKSFGKKRQIQIIGTDISEAVLAEAKNTVFSELALSRGFNATNRERYFVKTHEGFKLKAEISELVSFQQFNYESLDLGGQFIFLLIVGGPRPDE